VRLEAVEDAMVRRLVSTRSWHTPSDLDLGVDVAATRPGGIEWSYAETNANLDGVSDLLVELRKRVEVESG
jgi:hypothetical protein